MQNSYVFHELIMAQIEWLTFLEDNLCIEIEHIKNVGEHKIKNSLYRADGFHKDRKVIFEFNGCYYHGCKSCFQNKKTLCPKSKKSFEEKYEKTEKKRLYCIENGYLYISIWECYWKRIHANEIEKKQYIDSLKTILGL